MWFPVGYNSIVVPFIVLLVLHGSFNSKEKILSWGKSSETAVTPWWLSLFLLIAFFASMIRIFYLEFKRGVWWKIDRSLSLSWCNSRTSSKVLYYTNPQQPKRKWRLQPFWKSWWMLMEPMTHPMCNRHPLNPTSYCDLQVKGDILQLGGGSIFKDVDSTNWLRPFIRLITARYWPLPSSFPIKMSDYTNWPFHQIRYGTASWIINVSIVVIINWCSMGECVFVFWGRHLYSFLRKGVLYGRTMGFWLYEPCFE